MFARLLVGIIGGLLLGIAGAGLCMLAFGSGSGYWALLLFWTAGLATALAAPTLVTACRWLLIAAGLGVLLLVFSSAIVSDRLLPGSGAALQSPDHQNDAAILLLGMLLGGLALFAGLWIGREPARPARVRAATTPDMTDTFDALSATGKSEIFAGMSQGNPRRLLYVFVPALLLLCALLLWTAHEPAELAAPAALEPIAAAIVAPAAASSSAEVSTPPPDAVTPPPDVTPAAGTAAAAAPSPSRARQECMAQVEAARLFLGHAHASASRGDYEVRIRGDLERFQRERPVGPRTLTQISTAMWSRRTTPDPDASVWSREYSRCENARSSGSFYVVRGNSN